jgi:hypothetical protein
MSLNENTSHAWNEDSKTEKPNTTNATTTTDTASNVSSSSSSSCSTSPLHTDNSSLIQAAAESMHVLLDDDVSPVCLSDHANNQTEEEASCSDHQPVSYTTSIGQGLESLQMRTLPAMPDLQDRKRFVVRTVVPKRDAV